MFADATVLFAGIGWPRWSYEVLCHAAQDDFELVLIPLVIEQARRNLQAKLPTFVDAFNTWLSHIACEIAPDPKPESVAAHLDLVRDVEDIPVAVAGLEAHVDYLVSEDKDFTEESATRELRTHVTIMRASHLLARSDGLVKRRVGGNPQTRLASRIAMTKTQ